MAQPLFISAQTIGFGSNALTVPPTATYAVFALSYWGSGFIQPEIFTSSGLAFVDVITGVPGGGPNYLNGFIRAHGPVSGTGSQNLDIYTAGGADEGPCGFIAYYSGVDLTDPVVDSIGVQTTSPLQSASLNTEAECEFIGWDLGYSEGGSDIPNPAGWTSRGTQTNAMNRARLRTKDAVSLPTDAFATTVNEIFRVLVAYTLRGTEGGGGDEEAPALTTPTGRYDTTTTARGSVTTNEANGTLYHITTTSSTAIVSAVKAGVSQAVTTTGVQQVVSSGLTPGGTYYNHFVHTDAAGNDSTVASSAAFIVPAALQTPVIIGTPTYHLLGTSASPGAISVTVPDDAKVMVIHLDISGYPSPNNFNTVSSTAVAGGLSIARLDQSAAAAGLVVASGAVTATGAQTFTPAYVGANEFAQASAFVYFLDNVDPTNYVHGIAFAQTPDSTTAATATTDTLAGGLVISQDIRGTTASDDYPALGAGFTNIATGQTPVGGITYRLATRLKQVTTTTTGTASATTQNTFISAISLVSFKGAAVSGDEDAPTLSSPTALARSNALVIGSVGTDEANGTLYVVATTSSTAPTAAQVRAGQNHLGAPAVYASSSTVTSTRGNSFNVTGLTQLTTYYLHFHQRDAALNGSAVVTSPAVTTFRNGATGLYIADHTGPIGGNPAGILFNDIDLPDDEDNWFSFVITTPVSSGTLNINPDGTFTFEGPEPVTFAYQLEVNGVPVGAPAMVYLYGTAPEEPDPIGIAPLFRYNGTEFVEGRMMAWNGTEFISGELKVWNGSSWVPRSPYPALSDGRLWMNTDFANADWGRDSLYIDVFRAARAWMGHVGDTWDDPTARDEIMANLDSEGWPTVVPSGAEVGTVILVEQAPESNAVIGGRYRLDWQGTGTLEVRGGANQTSGANWVEFDYNPATHGTINIRISATAAGGNHIRRMRCYLTSQAALLAAGKITHPAFKDVWGDVGLLRFMMPMNINDNPVANWADRATPFTHGRGMSYEEAIGICNELGVKPWFNIPYAATIDYATQAAILVRDTLNPALVAYVEYANEWWNFAYGFNTYPYLENLAEGKEYNFAEMAGGRSTETMQAWTTVFSGQMNRIVRVAGMFTAWHGLNEEFLLAPGWVAEEPGRVVPHTVHDAIAVTGYFSCPESSWQVIIDAAEANYATGRAMLIDALNDDIDRLIADDWTYHRSRANFYNLELTMYEGGTHSVYMGYGDNAALARQLINDVNESAEMGAMYTRLMAAWDAVADQPFHQYSTTRAPSENGTFGAQYYINDFSQGRYQALVAYNNNSPSATAPVAFSSGQWTAAQTGTTSASVNLTALPANGGSDITALQYRLNSGAAVSFAGTGTGARTISGLTSNTAYSIQVRAVNAVGNGAWSDTKNFTTAAASTVPSAFTSGQWSVAADGATGAAVTVIALPTNGGSTITALQYRLDGGAAVAFSAATTGTYDIAGLTAETEYDIEIRAVNAVGNSAWSDLKTVTTEADAGEGGPGNWEAQTSARGWSDSTPGGLVVAKPAGTVASDILIARIGDYINSRPLTLPTGWTLIDSSAVAFGSLNQSVAWAPGDVVDMAFLTGSTELGSDELVIDIQRVSGIDLSNPIREAIFWTTEDEGGYTGPPEDLNPGAPSVTAEEGDVILSYYATMQTNSAFTSSPTTGYTRVSIFGGTDGGADVPHRSSTLQRSNVPAGSTGPIQHGTVPGSGYTARFLGTIVLRAGGSGGGSAVAPSAFTSGDWTATAGEEEIIFDITSLPSNGGSAITAIQFRIDGGSAISFPGTGTGPRTISGFTGGVEVDCEIRAVNAIGNGPWSDTKSRTPSSSSGASNIVEELLQNADFGFAVVPGDPTITQFYTESTGASATTLCAPGDFIGTLRCMVTNRYITWPSGPQHRYMTGDNGGYIELNNSAPFFYENDSSFTGTGDLTMAFAGMILGEHNVNPGYAVGVNNGTGNFSAAVAAITYDGIATIVRRDDHQQFIDVSTYGGDKSLTLVHLNDTTLEGYGYSQYEGGEESGGLTLSHAAKGGWNANRFYFGIPPSGASATASLNGSFYGGVIASGNVSGAKQRELAQFLADIIGLTNTINIPDTEEPEPMGIVEELVSSSPYAFAIVPGDESVSRFYTETTGASATTACTNGSNVGTIHCVHSNQYITFPTGARPVFNTVGGESWLIIPPTCQTVHESDFYTGGLPAVWAFAAETGDQTGYSNPWLVGCGSGDSPLWESASSGGMQNGGMGLHSMRSSGSGLDTFTVGTEGDRLVALTKASDLELFQTAWRNGEMNGNEHNATTQSWSSRGNWNVNRKRFFAAADEPNVYRGKVFGAVLVMADASEGQLNRLAYYLDQRAAVGQVPDPGGEGEPATAPSAFTSGEWALTGNDESLQINLTSMPANGGSVLTGYQYRLNGGAAVTMAGGAAGGSRNIAVAPGEYDVEVRAMNAIGNAPWSDTKTATATEAENPVLNPVPFSTRYAVTGHSIPDAIFAWPWNAVIRDAGFTPASTVGTGPFAAAMSRWENDYAGPDQVRATLNAAGPTDYGLFLGIEAHGGLYGSPPRASVATHIEWSQGYQMALNWHLLASSKGARTFYGNFWRDDTAEVFDASWRASCDEEAPLWDGIIDHVNANLSGTQPMRLVPWLQVFMAIYDAIEDGLLPGLTMPQFFQDNVHTSDLGAWVQMATVMAVMYQRHPDQLAINYNGEYGESTPDMLTSGQAAMLRPIIWQACVNTPRTGLN